MAPLAKLGPDDDIEAFLVTFEKTAEAAQWPRAQWSYVIGPYLTGEAQATLKALEKEEATDYRTLKEAILDRYEITPEGHRQSPPVWPINRPAVPVAYWRSSRTLPLGG